LMAEEGTKYNSVMTVFRFLVYWTKPGISWSERIFPHRFVQSACLMVMLADTHGNNKISLRTSHGKYVAADYDGSIYLTHSHHDDET
jgi:hypothetical protein